MGVKSGREPTAFEAIGHFEDDMQPGRIGLHLFLLLITLASLVAATAALLAKVGHLLTSLDHASKAQRARVLAAQFVSLADEVKAKIRSHRSAVPPADWVMELNSSRYRQDERAAEAEYHERLARWEER